VWALAAVWFVIFLTPHSQPWTPALQLGTLFVAFPAILILGANARASRLDGLSRLSGGLSYPVYALHYPLLIIVGGTVSRYGPRPLAGHPRLSPGPRPLLAGLALLRRARAGLAGGAEPRPTCRRPRLAAAQLCNTATKSSRNRRAR